MFCYKCGNKLPDDSRFCVHCGTAVLSSAISENAPPPAVNIAPEPPEVPSAPIEEAPIIPVVPIEEVPIIPSPAEKAIIPPVYENQGYTYQAPPQQISFEPIAETKKTKKWLAIAITAVLVLACIGASFAFMFGGKGVDKNGYVHGVTWDMTRDEVEKKEKDNPSYSELDFLCYEDPKFIDDLDCDVQLYYSFSNNKIFAANFLLSGSTSDMIDDFDEVVDEYEDIYGKPSYEDEGNYYYEWETKDSIMQVLFSNNQLIVAHSELIY